MKYVYDEDYLHDVRKRVAYLFQYAYDEFGYSIEKVLKDFSNSEVAWGIERALPYFMVGMSGFEMFAYIYSKDLEKSDQKPVRYGEEYWIGWSLVYLQWVSGMRFKDVVTIVPAERFYIMYGAYHEMDDEHLKDFAKEFLK